jgi:hypothetical protein
LYTLMQAATSGGAGAVSTTSADVETGEAQDE